MMNEEEIQVLIDKSKKQDMTAFALLVTEYRQLVFRLAFRLLCNEEEARDMVQETFIKVWSTFSKVVGVGKAHKYFPFMQSNDSHTACCLAA